MLIAHQLIMVIYIYHLDNLLTFMYYSSYLTMLLLIIKMPSQKMYTPNSIVNYLLILFKESHFSLLILLIRNLYANDLNLIITYVSNHSHYPLIYTISQTHEILSYSIFYYSTLCLSHAQSIQIILYTLIITH